MKTPLPRIHRAQSALTVAQAAYLAKQTATPFPTDNLSLLERLRYHVSGAIERGEGVAIVEIPAKGGK